MSNSKLLPIRHPQKDFFIADIFDNLPFKDDIASMEHPIFTLSKKTDLRELRYENSNVTVIIRPTTVGLPTIFDKDVLLYCGSLLMEQVNKGNVPPKTLRISTHDLLVATNRRTSGEGYRLLKKALDRLHGVSITTNIKTNKVQQTKAFHLIESYDIIESSHVKKRMVRLEITLSDWFYNSVIGKEVLTINRDYFRLGKSFERRIYELARKHCGRQKEWVIGLEKFQTKTGSTSSLKQFRGFIKKIAETNHLPDYEIFFSANDKIMFKSRKDNKSIEVLTDITELSPISLETINRAKQLVKDAQTGWDFNAIHEQFSAYIMSKEAPKNINGAFIGFVKKKVATYA